MSAVINGTNGITFPTWTTGTRPASPATGQVGFNTTTSTMEIYNGSAWTSIVANLSTGWSISASGTTLYFNYNGTNVAKLDSSGNITAAANVTAYGTV